MQKDDAIVAVKAGVGDTEECEPNETTYKAISDAESGNDMHGPFDSVKDLMEALDA